MWQRVGRLMLLPALLAGLAGCVRNERTASPTPTAAPATAPTAGTPAAERPRPQALSLRDPAAGTAQQTAAPAAPSQPPPDTPSTGPDLLETDRGSAVAPRDFRIGSLWVAQAGQNDAERVLTQFLDSLVKGQAETDLLEDASRDRLVRTLDYYQNRRPDHYRIGVLQEAADGEVLANVRLFGHPGVAEGEVYLTRSDAGWRVADLQVAFAMLDQTYTAPAEPYVPSTFEYKQQDTGDE